MNKTIMDKYQLEYFLKEIICKYINLEREKENIHPLTRDELKLFIDYNEQTIQNAINDLYKILIDESYILNININIELPPRINDENWLTAYIKEYL